MFESLKQDLLRQWQASAILRQGSWGILIVLLLYGVLWLDDELSLKNLEVQRLVNNLAELRRVEQQQHWPALVEELEQRLQQQLEQTWEARTRGLAQAKVQEFVNGAAADSQVSDLEVRRVELAQPQPFITGVREMRGRINAASRGSDVPWDWVSRLDSHSPQLLIDNLEVRVGSRSGVALVIEFRVLVRGLEDES